MKSSKYIRGVDFLAFNDSPGDHWAFDEDHLKQQMTVALLSDMFGVSVEFVARDIVSMRLNWAASDKQMTTHFRRCFETHYYRDQDYIDELLARFAKAQKKHLLK